MPGPALAKERQRRPRKPTIVQVKSIVSCVPEGDIRITAAERLYSTLKSHSWPTPVDGRAGQGADIRAAFRQMPVAGSRLSISSGEWVRALRRSARASHPAGSAGQQSLELLQPDGGWVVVEFAFRPFFCLLALHDVVIVPA